MNAQRSVWEVSGFLGLLFSLIWFGAPLKPALPVAAVVLVGICVGSNRAHNDSLERVGLAWKNFWPTVRELAPIALPVVGALFAIAIWRGQRSVWDRWFSFFGYPIWAFVQDYTMLGFVANRLEDAVGERPRIIASINGILFGLVHLPNPVLTPVTMVAGAVFTHVFLTRRHLIPIAIVHGLVGLGIARAFSDVTGIMSVGPAYLARIGVAYAFR
jgi:hypothetical protein